MKILPNVSLEEISKLNIIKAGEYKNKFVCYELKEDGLLKLTFFLNPSQSYSNHKAVANKKFMSMNKKMGFAKHSATFLTVDRSVNNLHTYIYQVDVNFDYEAIRKDIKEFSNELLTDDTLSQIMEVHSNKPYAVCLALKETKGKYKELEKKLSYEINTKGKKIFDLDTIHHISHSWRDNNKKVA